MKEIMDEFKKNAAGASFCLADDTNSGDWRYAKSYQTVCMALYRDFPELRSEMRDVARQELWADEFEDLASKIEGART